MKLNCNLVVSGFVLGASLAAGSAQAVTLQSLGYALGSKQPFKPSFAEDMKKGIALTQDVLGCTWASRPKIWAFDDALVFVAEGGTDYNAFTPVSALAKGCWLPESIVKKSGYTGLMPVKPGRQPIDLVTYSTTTMQANSLPVPTTEVLPDGRFVRNTIKPDGSIDAKPMDNVKWPEGFDFKKFLQNGVQLSQKQMKCTWAGLPFIYAFADGVIFTNSTGSVYNAYTIDEINANRCWMPSGLVEGGPGDADVNTNGETDKEEETTNFIDQHNAAQLCVGRWRWTETWDEGYTKTTVCSVTLVPYKVNVVDVDKGSADGFPGVTKSLSTQVLTEDLGVSEATTRNSDASAASVHNNAKTLLECNARVDEWVRTKSFRRTVVNGFVVEGKPEYAGLFAPRSINVATNKVVSNSPVIQGAKCTDSKFGACVAYSNKRQCQVSYQNDYYTVNYHEETLAKEVKDDPNCVPKSEHIPVIKTFSGQSSLNTTFAQISQVDNSFVELTKNKPRSGFVCSSGVHLKDTASKYMFLNNYIADNKAKPGIDKDPEFSAAVSTFWALFLEKSDEVANTDAMGLTNIVNTHDLYPALVFPGQRDEDLGRESPM